jgi:hypothetical protein
VIERPLAIDERVDDRLADHERQDEHAQRAERGRRSGRSGVLARPPRRRTSLGRRLDDPACQRRPSK